MFGFLIAGGAAGIICGLFGAGGGAVLVPLLGKLTDLTDTEQFSSSVLIMTPICLISLISAGVFPPFSQILPYLIGSCVGGIAAGLWGKKIPTILLHRIMGLLILWGGVRLIW